MSNGLRFFATLLAVSSLVSCGGPKVTHSKTEPATVDNKRPEADLTRITFTDDAMRRTGVETAVIEMKELGDEQVFTGIVTPAPGANSLVAAPFDGVVTAINGELPRPGARIERGAPVLALRGFASQSIGVSPDQAIRVRKVELDNARARLKRTLELIEVEGASEEDAERARADVAQAEAAYQSLLAPIDIDGKGAPILSPIEGLLGDYAAGLGQTVRAGDPLFRVTALDSAIVRTPVFASDLERIARDAPAKISRLGSRTPVADAVRIDGPPTATTANASVDLYFLLQTSKQDLRPGERVSVAVTLGDRAPRLTAPHSAIFTDIHGGTWVYEATGANSFVRRRVTVDYLVGDLAVLASGPPAGATIVKTGVAELAGSEFGVGK